jgi:hypothetical protein
MHGGMDERMQHERSKPSRETAIFLGAGRTDIIVVLGAS